MVSDQFGRTSGGSTHEGAEPRRRSLERPPPEVQVLFDELAAEWRARTAHLSSVERIILDPAYQRIIGLGPAVIPLLLRELERRPGHWFWALSAITGEDPAVGTNSFQEAVHAWLQWGRGRADG
jgi:hypothetical protein